MVRRMRWLGICVLAFGPAACGLVPELRPEAREVEGEDRATGVTTEILVRPRARPDGFEDVAEAAPESEPEPVPAGAGGSLGTTVASLGNPAEPGLWIKTPLVSREQPGRVRFGETGKTASVTLIPLDGPATAGSQLSLSAMQALGAPLTGLPTVEVLSGA